ncbi:MAG: coenzyme F420-0:L-glutamate ligase [Patescibacteria group bacterium]
MELIPLKSRLIQAKDNLLVILLESLKNASEKILDGDILIVTSKVVSVSENRFAELSPTCDANKIAKQESDFWLGGNLFPLAIKNRILIPRSGVDSSNVEMGKLILWPRDSWKSAEKLRSEILKKWGLRNFGIVISDSTCRPLRWGVSGIALAWSGFEGVSDERGKKDLFGRKLKVTRRAIADSLAAAAGILSGEAAERIPFVLIRRSEVRFTQRTQKPRPFPPKEDLFASIYKKSFRDLNF